MILRTEESIILPDQRCISLQIFDDEDEEEDTNDRIREEADDGNILLQQYIITLYLVLHLA